MIATADIPYADEVEERETLERFRSMDDLTAEDELHRLLRTNEIDRLFDLVYQNRHAARHVLQNERLASVSGKGWNLGLHAVHFHEELQLYIIANRNRYSAVARLRVDPSESKWGYSIVKQAVVNLRKGL
ncbi:MAG: hypothetical protein ABSE71_03730 [Candidatus Micrarchaeaceae archaeon]|jgi:hypothetical protein|nr:hypothetical protein [Candidatus Micrarchaeota archaeon]HII10134.1 hypothetical protein [Candidatus Micrarchaeota archaeon]